MPYYVYHIHTPGMTLDQGYIGLSEEPIKRWYRHRSKNSCSSRKLTNAIRKYNPLFTIIAVFDNLKDAQWQEYTLRPVKHMGWNIAEGGGVPPKSTRKGKECWNYGQKTPDSVRKKISESLKGRERSLEHREKISKNKSGRNHHNAKPADIYTRDGELFREDVIISLFCKEFGLDRGNLCSTTKYKTRFCKGFRAVYRNE